MIVTELDDSCHTLMLLLSPSRWCASESGGIHLQQWGENSVCPPFFCPGSERWKNCVVHAPSARGRYAPVIRGRGSAIFSNDHLFCKRDLTP